MNIVNLSPETILMLAEAATRADAEGRRLRLSFTPARPGFAGGVAFTHPATVSFKVGEGMWSAPFEDQPDPYRS